MATAMWAAGLEVASPASRGSRRRPRWSATSSSGSATSGSVGQRSRGGCSRPACRARPGTPTGAAACSGRYCRTPLMPGRPSSGKTPRSRGAHRCARRAVGPGCPNARFARSQRPPSTGSGLPYQPSSKLSCLRAPRSSWPRTGAATGSAAPACATCCKDYWSAANVATPSVGAGNRATLAIRAAGITTIAARGPRAIGSMVSPGAMLGVMPVAPLDTAVWEQVCRLLEDPTRVLHEYERRLQAARTGPRRVELEAVDRQLTKVRGGIGRLIDSYAEGLIDKAEFEPRLSELRRRVAKLEADAGALKTSAEQTRCLRLVIGKLEAFSAIIADRLDVADWATQRDLIRTLVQRIEIDDDHVRVVFRIDPGPSDRGGSRSLLQHCPPRDRALAIPPGRRRAARDGAEAGLTERRLQRHGGRDTGRRNTGEHG